MNKLPVTVNMIVRDGDDYVAEALLSVAPYVEKTVVMIDSRSKDDTRKVIRSIASPNNISIMEYAVRDPLVDLVEMRNRQLGLVKTPYVWIVDSDEVWPKSEVEKIVLKQGKELWDDSDTLKLEAYGFCNYAVYNERMELYSLSRRPAMRIFKFEPGMAWIGTWGNERLMYKDIDLCFDFIVLKPKYIHFTLHKKDKWRQEMGMGRRRRFPVVENSLREMPENIIKLVKQINAKKKTL